MADKLTKCPACNGRGYFYCDCHPADCICGVGDETCDECGGEGIIDPSYDDFDPPPPPQPNVVVSPDQDRMIRDIVRSAYDKGYNDARNVSAVPGDNSPGYRGRDVEKAHADELIARFKRLHTVAASRSSQSSVPTYVAPEIDGGRFEQWSLADFAAQCRMQSREQLDPEFSRFMAALASRLSKPSGIKVKPLRFEEAKAGVWTSGLVLGGEYRIMLTAGKGFQVSRGMIAVPDNQTWFPLLEIAEAAAFADYSARIMSAIEPASVEADTPSPQPNVALSDRIMRLLEDHDRCPSQARDYSRRRGTAILIMQAIRQANDAPAPSQHVAPAEHPIVSADRVYKVLKTYRDHGRFDWDHIGYICRDVAALATTEGKDNG